MANQVCCASWILKRLMPCQLGLFIVFAEEIRSWGEIVQMSSILYLFGALFYIGKQHYRISLVVGLRQLDPLPTLLFLSGYGGVR